MSTAKSLANNYLNGKRNLQQLKSPAQRFKSSTSNLTAVQASNLNGPLKSTSMTNLAHENQQQDQSGAGRMQRPASRNALDSIHNGMNAKYAQVQSKVYLQNIKPSSPNGNSSKIPASSKAQQADSRRVTPTSSRSAVRAGPAERSALQAKLKSLQEELEKAQLERESVRQELEREKSDKNEQLQQMKQELQDKFAEQDKQSEEYHQKLLEAYELADQNRRAADNVLSESRQRDEEARKKVEELESQLSELREFVQVKDEMSSKMQELREQIREERERYEEQLKSLHQVFENEKLR